MKRGGKRGFPIGKRGFPNSGSPHQTATGDLRVRRAASQALRVNAAACHSHRKIKNPAAWRLPGRSTYLSTSPLPFGVPGWDRAKLEFQNDCHCKPQWTDRDRQCNRTGDPRKLDRPGFPFGHRVRRVGCPTHHQLHSLAFLIDYSCVSLSCVSHRSMVRCHGRRWTGVNGSMPTRWSTRHPKSTPAVVPDHMFPRLASLRFGFPPTRRFSGLLPT